VAALRAAVPLLPPGTGTVVLLAADLPFVDAATVARLRAAVSTAAEAAVLLDDGGRDQYLVAAWTATAFRRAVSTVEDDRVSSVYALASPVARLAVAGYRPGAEPWRDVDDPAGLDRARASWEHSPEEPTPRG
jgi:molybdopterin-guanine dinucleotide biosynthesis protein A